MNGIRISSSDAHVLRSMAHAHANNVHAAKHFTDKRGNKGSPESVFVYNGSFAVKAYFEIDGTQEKLTFEINSGFAIGGSTTVNFSSEKFSEPINTYNAVIIEEDEPEEGEDPIEGELYQLNVIAEIWWDGAAQDKKFTITPSEITQNQATIGGTELGKEIPDNDPNGAYYARYQLATYQYRKIENETTIYSTELLQQDQWSSILIASRYI